MTRDPVTVMASDSSVVAARHMRDKDIGTVIVLDGDQVCGIVTDRDIVVREVAEGKSPETCTVGELCSKELTTLDPNAKIDDAVKLMREKAIRRLPVVENGKPVGIVSIGDLAEVQEPKSALADISSAPANN
jgi:CBS domain-containing protein